MIEPWAKTSAGGATISIIEHCHHVAVMARQLMASPILRRRLDTAFGTALSETHLDRLTVLAGIHDLGKCLKGFQDKLEVSPIISNGHVAEALAVLSTRHPDVLNAIQVTLLSSWFDGVTDAIYTSICHHGEPVGDDRVRSHQAVVPQLLGRTRYGHDPVAEIGKLADALMSQFPGAMVSAPPLKFVPAAQHLFAGVLMAADWMASGFAFFPGAVEDRAKDVLERTAWNGWHSGAAAIDLLNGKEPRPAQAGILALPLEERFAVIEAPTGTGKTEAGLIWASRLVETGEVDGLYFAVPTRSAATELHTRIGKLMTTLHPALAGRIVRALPGMLDVDDAVPDYPAETWAVAAPKRAFAAPIAVGTIDQALLSILRSRHAWMRAAFLSRLLLVVDEVHASDPYMAMLTKGLADRHLSLGGRVLAMSATLGETALAMLQGRNRRPIEEAIAAPYPVIRCSSGDVALPSTTSRTIDVVVEPVQNAANRALTSATTGGCVLWIRSTVRDAIADYQAFAAVGVPCMLHHSRYAVDDRIWLDGQLLSTFGLNGKRQGIVAVTTQTAEQSLDIDADLLITDAVPADVLVQRLGRLHRHRVGTRPTAVMIDPGPLDQYLRPNGEPQGQPGQGWPWVYRNILSVRSTLDWLGSGRSISIPDDCRALVERATHADYLRQIAESLGATWKRLWRNTFDKAAVDRLLAEASLIDWREPYRKALVTEWLPTRLGDGTVAVSVTGLVSPFTGNAVKALPIPVRWLPPGITPLDDAVNVVNGRFQIGGRSFPYDRFGVGR
jgi:CRISPR-associated endonuclease/helicase Cas3